MVVNDSGGKLIARGLGTTIAIGDRVDTPAKQQ